MDGLKKCPNCGTLNDADSYTKKMSMSPTGTLHYRCLNLSCGATFTQSVDEIAALREQEQQQFAISRSQAAPIALTDC